MSKHKHCSDRKITRTNFLSRSASEPPEVMSLDESETLLGSQYGINSRFVSPSVTVVDISGPITPLLSTSLNARPPIGPVVSNTPPPLLLNEQGTITSQGKFTKFAFYCVHFHHHFILVLIKHTTSIVLYICWEVNI